MITVSYVQLARVHEIFRTWTLTAADSKHSCSYPWRPISLIYLMRSVPVRWERARLILAR